MAEVQKTTHSGEVAAQFIEFVMMQVQNASLFLGLIPNPQTGKPELSLPIAKMFIDQLEMIQEKTRGNLSQEEEKILRNAVSQLQMAYVQASKEGAAESVPREEQLSAEKSTPEQSSESEGDEDGDNKKRFTKSYGA